MSLHMNALIVEPDEVWDYLDAGDDDRIRHATLMESWINSASLLLEHFCNRKIAARTYQTYQDGNGRRILYVENYPILAVERVEIFDIDLDGSDIINVAQSARELTWEADTGRLTLLPDADRSSFTKGKSNIYLEYSAGFAGLDLEPFRDAMRELIAQRWMAMGRDPLQTTRSDSGFGAGSVSITQADFNRLPPITQQVLRGYKRREV